MRGVGQTTNMIYNLPNERCSVVVPNAELGRALKNTVEKLRGKLFAKNVKFVTISSLEDIYKIMGYSHLIFFDHWFFEAVDEEVARKALDSARGAAIMYHTKKGNIK